LWDEKHQKNTRRDVGKILDEITKGFSVFHLATPCWRKGERGIGEDGMYATKVV